MGLLQALHDEGSTVCNGDPRPALRGARQAGDSSVRWEVQSASHESGPCLKGPASTGLDFQTGG